MKVYEFTTSIEGALGLKEVQKRLQEQLGVDPKYVSVKRSLDARRSPLYRYRCEIYEASDNYTPFELLEYKDVKEAPEVIVIGAGPAGLFASLRLLMLGLKPVILERGKDVHARKRDIAKLSREGIVNPDSNYCFGEGGAGTFSDGKLYTRSSKRGDNREVLHQLVAFGASEDILISSHPHIGSDRLSTIIENIRKCIIEHGGEYHFESRVTRITKKDGIFSVYCKSAHDESHKVYTSKSVILASGHSGRDVYEMLHDMGGELQPKGFALGVRVEHPQSIINKSQYNGHFRKGYPSAEYSFVQQVDGRGVFSFCMCPGGLLVPSSTKEHTVVLNGMSNSSRSSFWANSGVVVQIEPEDIPGDSPFKLMDFQQSVERAMYDCAQNIGGGAFASLVAPAQRMVDFCKGRISKDLPKTSYYPGVVSAPLHLALPEIVAKRLQKAFPRVKINGYYTNEALLLGVESRTSSPIRIPRDPQTLQYISLPGLFPCGEGAGYAGGIVSSAIDGIRAANALKDLIFN